MITQDFRVVTPSYGRDYKSKAAATADFAAGKDFTLQPNGCQCSVRDFAPGTKVSVRYKRMSEVMIVTVGEATR